uniref:DUF883 family protein n=2 Tax=Burkholderia cenocepacia TaxID=95486 RepID=UPI002158BA10|nr:YqjD family protein [Burkholderia cenocepacia]
MSEINKEKLMSDIKTVLSDAEDLLKQAASSTGDRAAELREKAMSRLKQAKEKAADVQVVVVEKGKKAARATDDYVHEHPWTSIGVAAGVGVLIGLGPVRFLVCRGHETITEITSYDRCNRDQEEQEPEGAEAVPR